jgi:hypothetical protein
MRSVMRWLLLSVRERAVQEQYLRHGRIPFVIIEDEGSGGNSFRS